MKRTQLLTVWEVSCLVVWLFSCLVICLRLHSNTTIQHHKTLHHTTQKTKPLNNQTTNQSFPTLYLS